MNNAPQPIADTGFHQAVQALTSVNALDACTDMLREIDGMLAHRLRSGLGKRELLKLASEVWNAAVITSAPADCKAAVRHCAQKWMFHHGLAEKPAELAQQLFVARRVAQEFVKAGSLELAESSFERAQEVADKIKATVAGAGATLAGKTLKDEVFKLHSSRCAFCVHQRRNYAVARVFFAAAHNSQPSAVEIDTLRRIAFDCGTAAGEHGVHAEAAWWFGTAHELAVQGGASTPMAEKAAILLAAARATMRLADWPSALSAVELANTEAPCVAGLQLALVVKTQLGYAAGELDALLCELVQHELFTEDTASCLFEEVALWPDSGLDVPATILQRYPSSLKLRVAAIKFQLRVVQDGLDRAVEKSLDTMKQDLQSGQLTPTQDLMKQLHAVLWNRGHKLSQALSPADAVNYFLNSLKLDVLGSLSPQDVAKLKCNVAACYSAIHEPLLAFQYAEECLQLDRTQVRAHFVCFCSFLERNDHVAAGLALRDMAMAPAMSKEDGGAAAETQVALLCLAVEHAFQHSNRTMAVAALETLLAVPEFANKMLVLRCLVRVTYTDLASVTESQALQTGLRRTAGYLGQAVKLVGAAKTTGSADWAAEAMWFAKVAWNLGLRACQETAVLPALAFRFFGLCSQFDQDLFEKTDEARARMKTATLMGAVAGFNTLLQPQSQTQTPTQQDELVGQVLGLVAQCRDVLRGALAPDPRTEQLLFQLEFRVHALAGHEAEVGRLAALIQQSTMPLTAADIRELAEWTTVHAVMASAGRVVIMLLRVAAEAFLRVDDIVQYGCAVFALVATCLQIELVDEALHELNRFVSHLEDRPPGHASGPVLTAILGKAWNTGLEQHVAGNEAWAHRFCGCTTRLLQRMAAGPEKDKYAGILSAGVSALAKRDL